ncbi:phosphoglucosamine mutase [Candidatus Woesearchaeota archaeon]|nr:phosphoglucosamine mutase [Candidatus Woesearchaeota archaeon]
MTRKLFGTDGVRGKINIFPLTAEIALKLGQATAIILRKRAAGKEYKNGKKRPKVVIGKDTRISGYIYEYALTSGLCSCGTDVYLVGPLPTPAIAHLTKSFGADAGIVISASHNPATDNGIKFFDSESFKLPDAEEEEIEKMVFGGIDTSGFDMKKVGKAYRIDDAAGRYIEYCKSTIFNASLSPFKLVIDCANGAAYKVAQRIFLELGAEVIVIGNTPNGFNINEGCGCLNLNALKETVLKNKADIGIGLDGDADRVMLVDEKGEIVDGDEIMAISASYMKEKGLLKNNKIVATVMSNIGFDIAMKKQGIKVEKTDVGDRYVIEKMRNLSAELGGEQSGHIIFLKHITTGDGIITALQVLMAMKHYKKLLSELKKCMTKYPQILINVDVKERKQLEKIKGYNEKIKEIENKLKEDGRILVRYSGTQNCCRVMLEGKDKQEITKYAEEIAKVIKKEIGV